VATPFESWATKVGWSAGAGIERHLGGNLTARIEYLHLDFIVRLGLNYKFDPLVPTAGWRS
jgi:opacity protein-like surface antigen